MNSPVRKIVVRIPRAGQGVEDLDRAAIGGAGVEGHEDLAAVGRAPRQVRSRGAARGGGRGRRERREGRGFRRGARGAERWSARGRPPEARAQPSDVARARRPASGRRRASAERDIAPTRYGPCSRTPSKRNRPPIAGTLATNRPPAKRNTAQPSDAVPSSRAPAGVSWIDSSRAAGAVAPGRSDRGGRGSGSRARARCAGPGSPAPTPPGPRSPRPARPDTGRTSRPWTARHRACRPASRAQRVEQ